MENSGKQNPKMGFKSPTLVLKNFATSRRLFLPAPAGIKLVAVDLNPRPSCYEPDEVHVIYDSLVGIMRPSSGADLLGSRCQTAAKFIRIQRHLSLLIDPNP